MGEHIHHHHHSSLSWATRAVSFSTDQVPPRISALSLLLPGTPAYVQLLQVFFFTVSLNLSLGQPRLRLPSHNCEWSSCRGRRWRSILSTCPSRLRFICISMSSIVGRPARFNTSMLVILSFLEMFIMARRCLIMYAWSFLTCTL